jgi:hypothetical protein
MKLKKKHDTCETRIQKYFIAKENQNKKMTKKTYPRLVLNRLKVMGNYTSIYTPWALN